MFHPSPVREGTKCAAKTKLGRIGVRRYPLFDNINQGSQEFGTALVLVALGVFLRQCFNLGYEGGETFTK